MSSQKNVSLDHAHAHDSLASDLKDQDKRLYCEPDSQLNVVSAQPLTFRSRKCFSVFNGAATLAVLNLALFYKVDNLAIFVLKMTLFIKKYTFYTAERIFSLL